MYFQHFVDERLKFAIFLYDSTVPPFEEIKRKIDANEPPYEDQRHPEDDSSEPTFLEEWERADLAVDVIGMTCLGQVQITLHTFLREFTLRIGGKKLLDAVRKMNPKSWLGKYQALYATDSDFDWRNSGVDIELLEEVVLTRNDFQHNADLLSPYTFQDERHKEKYPDSSFLHPTWGAILRNPRLHVTREKLVEAMEAVGALVKFLNEARQIAHRRVWKARSKAESSIPEMQRKKA